MFFDFERMSVRENYMPYVTEAEDPNNGAYERKAGFQMVIRSTAATEDDIRAVTEKIPLWGS